MKSREVKKEKECYILLFCYPLNPQLQLRCSFEGKAVAKRDREVTFRKEKYILKPPCRKTGWFYSYNHNDTCMHTRNIKSLSHSYYELKYHIVWTPKYRGKVLKPPKVKQELRRIIEQITKWKHWEILELNIQDNHIHLIISLTPRDSVSYAMQIIKGKSSA